MGTDAVLLDAPRLVDQALEDTAHGFGIERCRRLATQAREHISFAIGVVHRNVVVALKLTDGEHDLHTLCYQRQDAAIQVIDASA